MDKRQKNTNYQQITDRKQLNDIRQKQQSEVAIIGSPDYQNTSIGTEKGVDEEKNIKGRKRIYGDTSGKSFGQLCVFRQLPDETIAIKC
ncbi:hypothetical protein JI747_012455 [Chryseobacterium sp. RG1]|uniref:Uncharacterized protein n=1 Tax=Chryseobacterium tagetis TaxID=2801334 RepID=A0ABS8A3I5_9FLAO|nr:hypothetical protein [Chryseobacterium tagetis]MCA6067998.1 hypothetical protein [Chryseobacterium tagetis]